MITPGTNVDSRNFCARAFPLIPRIGGAPGGHAASPPVSAASDTREAAFLWHSKKWR